MKWTSAQIEPEKNGIYSCVVEFNEYPYDIKIVNVEYRGEWKMLETLLMGQIRKPLEQMQQKNIGYIDAEMSNEFYYKIDERIFCIKINEVNDDLNLVQR